LPWERESGERLIADVAQWRGLQRWESRAEARVRLGKKKVHGGIPGKAARILRKK
jgi:hypothetical protein